MNKSHMKTHEVCGIFLNTGKVLSCSKTLRAWNQTPGKQLFIFFLLIWDLEFKELTVKVC